MQQTPFHAYYNARLLESALTDDDLISAFASSNVKIYPFQIAAASFALKSRNNSGAVLCDEAGMGKSHEAMLVVTQKWLEGYNRILILIPNSDLLQQWCNLIDEYYTVPFTVVSNNEQWNSCGKTFMQSGVVISTYDFVSAHFEDCSSLTWELTVFDEANELSNVYQDENIKAKRLKQIASKSFKLLLTGTPIEKNIMDLYGLIWFIDETVFPDPQKFLSKYLRKPQNYPELSQKVSKYCFRTLRSQAKRYAKISNRIFLTDEYTPSTKEKELYDRLYCYVERKNKYAFPQMDTYDLALRLLCLQSSSTAAIYQTVNGVIKRLSSVPEAAEELIEWQKIKELCCQIHIDSKTTELIKILNSVFTVCKLKGMAKKAVVFTESVETQKMLYNILKERYQVAVYNGSKDYTEIDRFKNFADILISTDNGAKGFNMEFSSVVIHYDLPYNTLKIEQRIDRCHRLGQNNDVISIAFIDKNNFSDVRKLELINKRVLVTDGVFGISDDIIGGFSDDLKTGLNTVLSQIRPIEQIESDYQATLISNEADNRQLLSSAEDILFTTFTKELADKIDLTPRYISSKADELNCKLWEIVKWFFSCYNANNTDCKFEIDEINKTVTATDYEKLPTLFYYWNGSQNKKYTSLKQYGMLPDFKPRHGRITLSSIIGKGIIHNLECPDSGELHIKEISGPCTVGLYNILLSGSVQKELPLLVGKKADGTVLDDSECQKLFDSFVVDFSQSSHKAPHWLRTSSKPDPLDNAVDIDNIKNKYSKSADFANNEMIAKLKQDTAFKKAEIRRNIRAVEDRLSELKAKRDDISYDRLKLLAMDKQINLLNRELMKAKENQFFDEMLLDVELEEQIEKLSGSNNITVKTVREFLLEVDY